MTVVCLGEALIDLVPPPGQSPTTADQLSVHPGGAPLNIAIGLSKLGTPALFLGCLSEDAFGSRLAAVLDEFQVERVPGAVVAGATRLAVVDHLDTASPFRFYGSDTADTMLTRTAVDAALNRRDIAGLYVGSLMISNPAGREIQEYALASAERTGMPVFADPNPRPAAWPSRQAMVETTEYLLSRSAVAKLSLDDARGLGWPGDAAGLLRHCAERFPAQMFITDGSRGCWTLHARNMLHVAAPAVGAVDPTGAGDASFAALIAGYLATQRVGEAELSFAAAAGALATRVRGAIAGLPSRSDVEGLAGASD